MTPTPSDPLLQPVIGQPAAGPAARRRGRKFRRPLLLLTAGLGCAAAGVAGAVGLNGKPTEEHEPRPPAHPVAHREPRPDTTADRIDLAVRSGRFAEALKLIAAAPPEVYGPDPRPLAYRQAVALEGRGRFAEAAKSYGKAAGSDDGGPLWAWAALGQARCAAAGGDRTTARGRLAGVLLRSGRDPHVLAECLYQRARLAVAATGPHPAPDPLDIDALAWPPLLASVEHVLPDGLDGHHYGPNPAGGGEVVIHRWRWVRGHEAVTARFAGRPAAEVLTAIGAAAGWPVALAPDAAAALSAPVTVDVERVPLADVFAALTEPHQLSWTAADGVVTVRAATHVESDGRRTAAGVALRRALAAGPDHPSADAARVTLANLARSADGYRQFLADRRDAAEAVHAAYNLGLVELADSHPAAARARFLEVIDRGPRTAWAPLGQWWVARSHLDAGETAAARKPLAAALETGSKDVRSAAALGLTVADLLDGDAAAARSRLRTFRFSTGDAHAAAAGWLTALLRQRATPSAGRAGELLAAVRDGDHGRPLGPAGVWVAGQAYRAAGRPERMADLYEAAVAAARGPLAVRMTLATADHLYQLDRTEPARQRYLAVAALDPAGLGPAAELRLAELAAREGRGAECVGRCRRLVGRPGVDRGELLAVMARGYEHERKFRAAADCLVGRLPPE